jgi:hypothetical protein
MPSFPLVVLFLCITIQKEKFCLPIHFPSGKVNNWLHRADNASHFLLREKIISGIEMKTDDLIHPSAFYLSRPIPTFTYSCTLSAHLLPHGDTKWARQDKHPVMDSQDLLCPFKLLRRFVGSSGIGQTPH